MLLHSNLTCFNGFIGQMCLIRKFSVMLPLSECTNLTFICDCLSGAICIPIFLPLTVLFLICVSRSPEASVLQWPPPLPSTDLLWDPLAVVVLIGWVSLHALLYMMPVGKV